MRRPTLIATLALLASGIGVAQASADKVTLSAKTTTCTTGADDASRAAAFTGAMPAGAQTKRMQMRFVLIQRKGVGPKGTFKKIAVPGWGGWVKSDPDRQGFVFTKRVEALTAPAGYRAVITFRWVDGKGHVQRTATRTTPVCEQPDPRPDLVLSGVDATATGKSTAAYTLSIGNEGHSDAVPFAVTITVDGTVSGPVTLGPIVAGGRLTGTLAAPRCTPGSTILVTVDVADTVAESVESDDAVQRPCPLA
ncbi:MAG TPA: CARDB domain-containing protein [Baekduia sp.]|nr:CARDB domain-containing protein [Baekduia sp.]